MHPLSRSASDPPPDLAERVQRVESHQALFQGDVHAQIARADAIIEDLVTSVEKLRRRVEELERANPGGDP